MIEFFSNIFISKFPPLDLHWRRDTSHVAHENGHAITHSLQLIAGDSWLISNDGPDLHPSSHIFAVTGRIYQQTSALFAAAGVKTGIFGGNPNFREHCNSSQVFKNRLILLF